jgi:hypothetical protein
MENMAERQENGFEQWIMGDDDDDDDDDDDEEEEEEIERTSNALSFV